MKSSIILLISLLIFTVSCTGARTDQAVLNRSETAGPKSQGLLAEHATAEAKARTTTEASFTELDKSSSGAEAFDRKIIRNADITMEVSSTTEAQHRVTSIAEGHGGFVVNSEAKQRESADPAQRTLDIKLVVRIPANQFGVALDEIKKLAENTPEEQVTGQDVTEEFIDLEARIKTQKALEIQFLEIMRQATKVADALEVQRQIAEVRTDIEKLEGRKRFLENKSSLSTITVKLQAPKPVITVTSTGFGKSLREAISDSVGLASDMLLFLVRFVILMVPITLIVLLPAGLVVRFLLRRAQRIRLAQSLATPAAAD